MSQEGDQVEALREQLSLLRSIADKVPSMLAYWDADQRCRYANAAYERWFGVKPEDLIGNTMESLLGPIYARNLKYIVGALRGEEQTFEREIPDPAGGPPRYSQGHYLPDVSSGIVRGFVVLVSDITARRQLELQLREAQERAETMAAHDFLTGLPNRVLLEDRINRAIEASKRYKRQCCVLFLDLDGFKSVNDLHGHAAGDGVLREIARRLLGSLRESDTVARLGGDEFLVLLPEVGQREQAAIVAQKLLTAIAGEGFLVGEVSLSLSFSVGIALYPDDKVDMRELLSRADSALYDAKHAGKNQFAFFGRGQ